MSTSAGVQPWLLLIHQIPPKPDYLRVKIGRRLQRVGAVAVKNSVYVLPDGAQRMEDFQWVRAEIVDGGGEASICRADFVDGLTSEGIRELFREARGEDFSEIASTATALLARVGPPSVRILSAGPQAESPGRARPDDDLVRLRKRFAAVSALNFFDAPERHAAEEALEAVEARSRPDRAAHATPSLAPAGGEAYRARTWVTREGVFVDRIASAWLIRRFIDPDATFAFVPPERQRTEVGAIRFDMFGGEFTHEGERCTFEVLLSRFGLTGHVALDALAEIVHDIDLKDATFGRDETAGVELVMRGIVAANDSDAARLERGAVVLDELYALLSNDHSAQSGG